MILPYYLAIGASYAAIVAVSSYAFFVWRREQLTDRVSRYFGLFGLVFSLPMVINLLWAFSALTPTAEDTLFINGSFSVVAAVLTLMTIHSLTLNRNLLYLLALFGVTLILMPYNLTNFFTLLLFVSNILFLIVSLEVLIVKRYHIQFAGLAGAAYAIISILFTVLLYSGFNYTGLWWFLPNVIFALMILMLHMDKKYYLIVTPKLLLEQKPHVKRIFFGLNFLKYTLYISSVTAFTFIATVSVHELGHALAAYYYGCEPTRIVYDLHDPPYTEISCASATGTQLFVITAMGLVSVLVSSAIFYFTEGKFTTRLAYLMLGFGLVTFYKDVLVLGASQNIAALLMMSSFIVIIAAIVSFSLFYINEHSRLIAPLARAATHLAYEGKSLVRHENRRRD